MCQEGKEKTISPEMIHVLQEDSNYSLAQMGLKQHIKNRIIRLKDIFITAKVTIIVSVPIITSFLVDRCSKKSKLDAGRN